MANRTVKDANSVKGTNPQYLVEKIIRTRIYESRYWKEECFALSAELLVDKAMELKYIGGVFGGNIKPTPFLCLVLKMLQIQPEKDIVIEFIRNEDFKYVRALGAFYIRLIGTTLDCYKYLEPLYNDFRKIKRQNRQGEFTLVYMDEFIDELLREDRVNDVILPRIQKRQVLEDTNQLDARISALDEDMDIESDDEDEYKEARRSVSPVDKRPGFKDWDKPRRSPSPKFRRSSRSPHKHDKPSRHRDRHRGDRERHRDKEHDRHRDHRDREHKDRGREGRERHRSRSRERKHKSRSKSPGHRHRKDDEDRHHRHHKSKKSKKDRRDDRDEKGEDPEIREANELRAKLGMAPLRP